jgi:hypothetical protein
MVAPMADVGDNSAQLWQTASGMQFRQLGGYAIRAAPKGGKATFLPDQRVLTLLFAINPNTFRPYHGRVTPALIAGARAELAATGTKMFIVGPSRFGEPRQLEIAQQIFGRPPDRVEGGVSIWTVP